MRLLALADTQLGVRTVELADQAEVLGQIAGAALEHQVDLVVHGGDVFEGPIVTPEQLRVFLDFAKALRIIEIPLLVLRGNGRHDLATRSVHALDVLREIDNIEVSDRPGIYNPADIGIVTLPWVSPGNLIAQWGRDVDHDQVNDYAGKLLVEIAGQQLERLRESRLVHDCAVLVAHWAISGSTLPTGLSVDQMREPILSWPDVDALGFDAIIGAHVHEPQQISQPGIDATLGFVVGSPQQLNHGEHGDHGVWILDVEPGQTGNAVSTEFIPIESKQFVTFDYQYDTEFLVDSATSWDGFVPEGAIVRMRYHATEEQARKIDQGAFRASLLAAGASRVSLEPQIIRASRARAETLTEDLGPLEALHMYADAQGLDESENGRMVERLGSWIQA